jgi:hypothetical protein
LFVFATSFISPKNKSPQNPNAITAHSSKVKLGFITLSSKNTFLTQSQ